MAVGIGMGMGMSGSWRKGQIARRRFDRAAAAAARAGSQSDLIRFMKMNGIRPHRPMHISSIFLIFRKP